MGDLPSPLANRRLRLAQLCSCQRPFFSICQYLTRQHVCHSLPKCHCYQQPQGNWCLKGIFPFPSPFCPPFLGTRHRHRSLPPMASHAAARGNVSADRVQVVTHRTKKSLGDSPISSFLQPHSQSPSLIRTHLHSVTIPTTPSPTLAQIWKKSGAPQIWQLAW